MPHISAERYAVVSCHVERPLDDACWSRFTALQARCPGGFRIAALMRPPDGTAGEDAERWLARAREASARGPLGHHTHFVSPERARPAATGPEHAERVRREAAWLRAHGLEATVFCGGGWYMDETLAEALAELGYADCTATAFRPAYLAEGAPRLQLAAPARLVLPSGSRLLELPATHSLGMATRAALAPRLDVPVVHVYFHDTDLLSGSRRAALACALAILGRRCVTSDLETLQQTVTRPEVGFREVSVLPGGE
ncbi:MAG TPA: hypothetical protein VE995_08230 [Gaiellaceae bacterium]|nr:hypothetical protein [Gaiellaceae bacterium]